jgi:hypothetical protein
MERPRRTRPSRNARSAPKTLSLISPQSALMDDTPQILERSVRSRLPCPLCPLVIQSPYGCTTRLSGLLVGMAESCGLLKADVPPKDGPGGTHATAAAAAAATAWQRCGSWGQPLGPTRVPLASNSATREILPLTIEQTSPID